MNNRPRFNENGDLDFKLLLEAGKLRHPELCDKYRRILMGLNEEIKTSDLDLIVNSLFASFYNMAVQELDDIVMNKEIKLSNDKRMRVMGLLSKGEKVREAGELAYLFKQKIVDEYRTRIIKPGYSLKKLRWELGTVGNCWINESNIKYIKNRIRVAWHIRDINIGSCVLFIGEKPSSDPKSYNPVVQARNYIAMTKANEPVLFIDTIEAGHTDWSRIEHWISKERGRELLYSVAAPIYVARHLGIEKVVLGERETAELGMQLGFKEETIFDDRGDGHERKIGVRGDDDGEKGPYVYQLRSDRTRRVINVKDIIFSKETLLKRLDGVTEFLKNNEKIRKNKQKMEEVKLYLNCIELVNESSGIASKDVYYGIFKLREDYFKAA